MSIFSRLSNIFQARANSMADQLEDPKASLDYSLTRLEESHSQITRSLVEVSSAERRLKDQQEKLAAAIKKYDEQAKESVNAGRDDLARTALERKQTAESQQVELQSNLDSLQKQLVALKDSEAGLSRKISLFHSKKEELKAVYDSSRAQLSVRESLSGISQDLADVGNTIQRAERRIREMQSRSEAIQGLIAEGVLTDVLDPEHDDIDRELGRISHKQAVEEELAKLKEEAAKSKA